MPKKGLSDATLAPGRRAKKRPGPKKQWEDDWLDYIELVEIALGAREAAIRLGARAEPVFDIVRRHCYEFVRACRNQSALYIVREATKSNMKHARGREPRSPAFKENPFAWALLATAWDVDSLWPRQDETGRLLPGQSGTITAKRVNEIGNRLLYADKHDIDPGLLCAFLRQAGPTCVRDRTTITERWVDAYKQRSSRN